MSHPILQMLVPIADGIAKTLGDNCEVAIHDLTHPSHSIYYVVNGNLMGRKKGDTLGPAFKELIYLAARNQDNLINYYHHENGHSFKCTKTLIRDENGKVIGCFCINLAIDDYLRCKQAIDALCHTESIDRMKMEDSAQPESEDTISDLAREIVLNSYADFKKARGKLKKADKIELAQFLDQKGIFQVKGTVEMVADLLQVSKYTVYRYVGNNHTADSEGEE